jgi:hypothetical protein
VTLDIEEILTAARARRDTAIASAEREYQKIVDAVEVIKTIGEPVETPAAKPTRKTFVSETLQSDAKPAPTVLVEMRRAIATIEEPFTMNGAQAVVIANNPEWDASSIRTAVKSAIQHLERSLKIEQVQLADDHRGEVLWKRTENFVATAKLAQNRCKIEEIATGRTWDSITEVVQEFGYQNQNLYYRAKRSMPMEDGRVFRQITRQKTPGGNSQSSGQVGRPPMSLRCDGIPDRTFSVKEAAELSGVGAYAIQSAVQRGTPTGAERLTFRRIDGSAKATTSEPEDVPDPVTEAELGEFAEQRRKMANVEKGGKADAESFPVNGDAGALGSISSGSESGGQAGIDASQFGIGRAGSFPLLAQAS